MKDTVAKSTILVLLILVVGLPVLMRSDDKSTHERDTVSGARLVIVTPHNEQTRFEFTRAFNAWRQTQGLEPVYIDWRTSGGTSDLRKQVLAEYAGEYRNALKENREPRTIGYDLFFGGGDYEHNQLANGGVVTVDDRTVAFSTTQRIRLPRGLLEEAIPDRFIGGEPLYHPDLHWIGVALSSFGIVYNRDVLGMLKLPEPQTWADLKQPAYAGWVGLADPAHSGSIATTYNAILRREGWAEGWAMLRRVYANARYFVESASKVPVDVSTGEAAAGMCIDFYGRFQAGAVQQTHTEVSRVGYIDPAHTTAVSADPISLMNMAPNRELAEQFIAWLLSREAQMLWQAKRGTLHGPTRFELRRLPIRRDLYAPEYQRDWVDRDAAPYQIARTFPQAMPDFRWAVGIVSHAMAIDIHDDLRQAWQTIRRAEADHHPQLEQMLQLFDAMPDELTLHWVDESLAGEWQVIIENPEHARYDEVMKTLEQFVRNAYTHIDSDQDMLEARLRWTAFFRGNYGKIIEMGKRGE